MIPPRERVLRDLVTVFAGGLSGIRFFGAAYPAVPHVMLVNRQEFQIQEHWFLGIIEAPGSHLGPAGPAFDEDFLRIDLYGRVTGDDQVTPREWAGRLRTDVMRTLRYQTGIQLSSVKWVDFGEEDIGFDDRFAEFLVPCTLRLMYDIVGATS